MNCPKEDKLTQYVDDLLTEQEHAQLNIHLKTCDNCRGIVQLFKDEQQFLIETLQTQTLPDNFASLVLEQLEPYVPKIARRKSRPWKRALLLAAGIVFALGLTATLSPTFAQFIGGMFSTEQVDKGLRMAAEKGLEERVNLEVNDQGLTLKVEDIFVDSSRVAISIQIIDENGIAQRPNINDSNRNNRISVTGYNGKNNIGIGYHMDRGRDYNLIQVPLNEDDLENITIKLNFVEMNGKIGKWKLEVPVDLTNSSLYTTSTPLNNMTKNIDGITINLKEIQFASSSTTLLYETSFLMEEQAVIDEQVKSIVEKFGEDVSTFGIYNTFIHYHLENEQNKSIFKHHPFFTNQPWDNGLILSSGRNGGLLGYTVSKESFVPQKVDSKLTFVLDGVYKSVPSNYSVKFNPKKIKDVPVSFEYEGNLVSITNAELQTSVKQGDSSILQIVMEGRKEDDAAELGVWALMDDTGKSYVRLANDSTKTEKENNNSYKRTINFLTDGLEETPKELTLHLLSVSRYQELQDKWKVPLYK
ncbi:DUF4179 domain-containing protein [Psychrobacillus glaciei]|uniref:Anti-sigma-W factor RsiW n=1 Tax=Psychrobacillus glaciei TaxID=2283160 RepID=A0A5J6SUW8_9BACI|nr:DUF4179 domain-containing protein [Psychrobacillus glaciei]QFG00038.1 DUF4179 domain-containing protein [Psychrobacillus glaciei]